MFRAETVNSIIPNPTRCGVIPYTVVNNKLYLLFARHKETKELGDFGGGIKKKENVLSGGHREFIEESNGIFKDIYRRPEDLNNMITLFDGKGMAVIFVPISKEWLEMATSLFKKSIHPDSEISDIIWLGESTFKECLSSTKKIHFWSRVRNFLKRTYTNNVSITLKRSFT